MGFLAPKPPPAPTPPPPPPPPEPPKTDPEAEKKAALDRQRSDNQAGAPDPEGLASARKRAIEAANRLSRRSLRIDLGGSGPSTGLSIG
jgi:hypothetical protein